MEEEPHGCRIAYNVIEDIGLILKHVSGVALTAARGNLVSHNRIERSPRYGKSCFYKAQGVVCLNLFAIRVNLGSLTRTGVSFLTWTNADGSGWGISRDNVTTLAFNLCSILLSRTFCRIMDFNMSRGAEWSRLLSIIS